MFEAKRIQPPGNFKDPSGGGTVTRKMAVSVSSIVLGICQLAAAGGISFKPVHTYAVDNPAWVVAGDFNNDGKRDMVVINQGDPTVNDPGGISIFLGNGDGTFQFAKNVAIGKNCTNAEAGDFNGDGNTDLALLRPGDPNVSDDGDVTIFLGNGDGTFRQGQVLTPGKNPSGRNSPIIALDLNGDQHLDLVVANSIDHSFSVLLGNGDGTFQPPVVYTVQGQPRSVFSADLTGNGRKDLVVFGGYVVSNWFGNGDGTFRFGSSITTRYGILVGDFNGDKIDDLVGRPFVFCIFNCKPVAPLLWLSGTSEPPLPVAQGVVAAGDFDGDGKLDLVGTGTISPGNGDGTFQPQISIPVSDSGAQVLDVNGDGAPDLVLIRQNAINLLVNTGTDFSISASALNPGTLSTGQSASSSLTLKLLSNFDNPVSLTCAVQPAQTSAPTCSLSSSSVTFDASGEASAALTISAGSSGVSVDHYRPFSKNSSLWFPVAGFAFLATGFGVGTSRRRHFVLPIGAVLFIGIILQTACGGGSNSVPKSTAYTITITGTAATTQHSTTVSLTLQ
jgi:FG-GAP-like repeat